MGGKSKPTRQFSPGMCRIRHRGAGMLAQWLASANRPAQQLLASFAITPTPKVRLRFEHTTSEGLGNDTVLNAQNLDSRARRPRQARLPRVDLFVSA